MKGIGENINKMKKIDINLQYNGVSVLVIHINIIKRRYCYNKIVMEKIDTIEQQQLEVQI